MHAQEDFDIILAVIHVSVQSGWG